MWLRKITCGRIADLMGPVFYRGPVLSTRHYANVEQQRYLRLDDIGVFDNEDLSKSAALVAPSSYRRHILLVQPIYKNAFASSNYNSKTTPELQLQEAQALVSTMESRLRVCETLCLSTKSERKKLFFGKGNFRKLLERVAYNERKHGNVTVFLNVNTLTPFQQYELRLALGVDVYDRYMLVLQIFKHHARSKEAKLQTSLAEIPYFRAAMGFHGSDQMLVQLGQREVALRQELENLKEHRALLRQERRRMEVPVAAVVGYTNAGKTSLIKKLTDSRTLQPKDQLFATLDVTCHPSRLPKLGKVLYVDTVGFISDIPTQLIGSFRATLEDALLSDCIIHIYDLSHPDLENQCEIVMKTLEEIETPRRLVESIVHLGNKVDLLSDPDTAISRAQRILGSCIPISAVTAAGIRDALEVIEGTLLENSNRTRLKIRCRTGGPEYAQIYRRSDTVLQLTPDSSDENFSIMEVTVSPANQQRLRAEFKGNPSVEFV
ncbi:putative GTP-binding protein 6 [Galendromus occidentalis]|uniref:GTP-binding protein 6 n=1 Tax=Galendromus occidentalis TaxID=34638 RepID=A0AAJ6VWI8_9ACAR|nr:putative GTP-binding protein 6 [Galendromus occidentalis]